MVFWSALKRKIRESFTRKEFDAEAVKLTGAQTIQGAKTFTNVVKAAAPVANNDLTTKQYVDSKAYDANDVYNKTQSDQRYIKKSNTENLTIENTANTIIRAHTANITATTGDIEFRVPENKSVNLGSRKITGLADPTAADTAVNKGYADRTYYQRGNVPNPAGINDAVNKLYVDTGKNALDERIQNNQDLINQNIVDIGTKANRSDLNNYVLKTNPDNTIISAPIINLTCSNGDLELRPSGAVSCGNKIIKQVAGPTANDHAANKKYVDDKFNSAGQFDPTRYYDKTASDNRYYQKSQVYTKTESDNRYYQKSQVYTKTESDNKFLEKTRALTVKEKTVNVTGWTESRDGNYWTYYISCSTSGIRNILHITAGSILAYPPTQYFPDLSNASIIIRSNIKVSRPSTITIYYFG